MALKLQYTTEENVIIEYWKITSFSYLWPSGKYEISVSGFLDKASRDILSKPIVVKTFKCDAIKENLNAQYNYIKTESFFASSEDVD